MRVAEALDWLFSSPSLVLAPKNWPAVSNDLADWQRQFFEGVLNPVCKNDKIYNEHDLFSLLGQKTEKLFSHTPRFFSSPPSLCVTRCTSTSHNTARAAYICVVWTVHVRKRFDSLPSCCFFFVLPRLFGRLWRWLNHRRRSSALWPARCS